MLSESGHEKLCVQRSYDYNCNLPPCGLDPDKCSSTASSKQETAHPPRSTRQHHHGHGHHVYSGHRCSRRIAFKPERAATQQAVMAHRKQHSGNQQPASRVVAANNNVKFDEKQRRRGDDRRQRRPTTKAKQFHFIQYCLYNVWYRVLYK